MTIHFHNTLTREKQVFEQIASGRPLPDVLHTLVQCIEAQSSDSLICSVLLASDDGSYVSGARIAVTGGRPIL